MPVYAKVGTEMNCKLKYERYSLPVLDLGCIIEHRFDLSVDKRFFFFSVIQTIFLLVCSSAWLCFHRKGNFKDGNKESPKVHTCSREP